MIENITKLKNIDFRFPIKNAKNAIYKVVSVNELDKLNSSNGNWGAVILAQADKTLGYMVPEHVVFTIEYDNMPPMPTFKITAITSENETAKIEVGKLGVSSMDKFIETLQILAEHSNFKI
jgi:hypothetical protein